MLTDKQAAVLRVIEDHLREHEYPPTVREIAIRLGFRSTNGVACHLKALKRKGYLDAEPHKSRTIRLRNPILERELPPNG